MLEKKKKGQVKEEKTNKNELMKNYSRGKKILRNKNLCVFENEEEEEKNEYKNQKQKLNHMENMKVGSQFHLPMIKYDDNNNNNNNNILCNNNNDLHCSSDKNIKILINNKINNGDVSNYNNYFPSNNANISKHLDEGWIKNEDIFTKFTACKNEKQEEKATWLLKCHEKKKKTHENLADFEYENKTFLAKYGDKGIFENNKKLLKATNLRFSFLEDENNYVKHEKIQNYAMTPTRSSLRSSLLPSASEPQLPPPLSYSLFTNDKRLQNANKNSFFSRSFSFSNFTFKLCNQIIFNDNKNHGNNKKEKSTTEKIYKTIPFSGVSRSLSSTKNHSSSCSFLSYYAQNNLFSISESKNIEENSESNNKAALLYSEKGAKHKTYFHANKEDEEKNAKDKNCNIYASLSSLHPESKSLLTNHFLKIEVHSGVPNESTETQHYLNVQNACERMVLEENEALVCATSLDATKSVLPSTLFLSNENTNNSYNYSSNDGIHERLSAYNLDRETILEETGSLDLFWSRFIWLAGLLVFQSASSFIMIRFENMITHHPQVVYFLTMLVGAGGNAGSQSAVLVIRKIAINQFDKSKAYKLICKQFYIGLLLASALSLICFARVYLFNTNALECAAICASMFVIVVISTVLGTVLPLFLYYFNIDPAHAGAAIQVMMDIVGVTLTFIISSFILDYFAKPVHSNYSFKNYYNPTAVI